MNTLGNLTESAEHAATAAAMPLAKGAAAIGSVISAATLEQRQKSEATLIVSLVKSAPTAPSATHRHLWQQHVHIRALDGKVATATAAVTAVKRGRYIGGSGSKYLER
ncbi:hypothetical protein cyc_03764 [Cyclospora cayetanensis]|uniref:Uncharacterized protein n=1 Tax=Cyclospora cayetanensis TaxID=88456 RepID=A0A1D3CY24_9EIME|nr:hypothetical protein cyc_03764 [Cyclospora cayetanensis]